MNKFLLALLLTISASAQATQYYTCKDLQYVEYEVEDLAELAVDTQFNQANRIKIFDEYFFMIGERELLRKSCTPNYPPSTPAKEFMHKGEIYMVIEESNDQY